MSVPTTGLEWRKVAAWPGIRAVQPTTRLLPTTWQQLRTIVADVEAAPGGARDVRACGSHWAFSDAAVTPAVMIETNDPDDRDNPAVPRMDQPLYDVIPDRLSAQAVEFFSGQSDVDANWAVLTDAAKSVVHVQAGMRIAHLYSFLDVGDGGGHHLALRFPQYGGSWAMPTLGGAGGQTVAGATQTGTHGGDVHLPPIADAIVAMHVIGAAGRHLWIERTSEPWGHLIDDEALEEVYPEIEIIRSDDAVAAAQVACGRFGIVYSVVLRVVRQFAVHEVRSESSWSQVRPWLDDPMIVGSSWFTSIIVNPLGQMLDAGEHSAWVTRRWREPLATAGTPVPAGRTERTGVNAGREATFDPEDKDSRDSFMNRVCEGAHPIRAAIDILLEPVEDARDAALITAAVAQAGIAAALFVGLPPPPPLVAARDSALLVAAASQATIGLLEAVKALAPENARINQALGDIANFLADIDQFWILRGIADFLMGQDQAPRDVMAISYALMDIHNYRDWVCSKDGESIEVFFDAWAPDAKQFIDLVFQRVAELEAGTLAGAGGQRMAFPGYIAIRFTRDSGALLAMQRWTHTVSIEIASVNASKGTRPLLAQVHQDAVEVVGPNGPGASIHWGQKNHTDMGWVEEAYGAWIAGGRLARWRDELSSLTRNGRDATFSTPFSRYAGLEVVQPLIGGFAATPSVVCADTPAEVRWNGEDNPPGTTAALTLSSPDPMSATRTLALPPLTGSMTVDVPAGRHKIGFTVAYELNGRVLRDHRTVDVRGIVSGDVATFELVPSCWSIDGADRWWVDVNVGDTTYGPGVVVETLRLAAWVPGAWRARRPQRPDVLLATPLTPVVIADRPAMTGSSWRFVSDTSGCVGPVPTLRIEFGLGCGPP